MQKPNSKTILLVSSHTILYLHFHLSFLTTQHQIFYPIYPKPYPGRLVFGLRRNIRFQNYSSLVWKTFFAFFPTGSFQSGRQRFEGMSSQLCKPEFYRINHRTGRSSPPLRAVRIRPGWMRYDTTIVVASPAVKGEQNRAYYGLFSDAFGYNADSPGHLSGDTIGLLAKGIVP